MLFSQGCSTGVHYKKYEINKIRIWKWGECATFNIFFFKMSVAGAELDLAWLSIWVMFKLKLLEIAVVGEKKITSSSPATKSLNSNVHAHFPGEMICSMPLSICSEVLKNHVSLRTCALLSLYVFPGICSGCLFRCPVGALATTWQEVIAGTNSELREPAKMGEHWDVAAIFLLFPPLFFFFSNFFSSSRNGEEMPKMTSKGTTNWAWRAGLALRERGRERAVNKSTKCFLGSRCRWQVLDFICFIWFNKREFWGLLNPVFFCAESKMRWDKIR